MDYAKESLKMHYELKGKTGDEMQEQQVDSKDALSLAYTPGVAQPCLEIQKDINKSYELTRRWNTGCSCDRRYCSSGTWRYRTGGWYAGYGRKMCSV